METPTTNTVQEQFERLQEKMGSEYKRLQIELVKQTKSLEGKIKSGREKIEKQTQTEVARLVKNWNKSPLAARAKGLRSVAGKKVEVSVDNVLDALHVASKDDLKKIDRKLNQLNKKLKALEKLEKEAADISAA